MACANLKCFCLHWPLIESQRFLLDGICSGQPPIGAKSIGWSGSFCSLLMGSVYHVTQNMIMYTEKLNMEKNRSFVADWGNSFFFVFF